MKPAVHSNKGSVPAGLLVGGFALWWYWEPFTWLAFVMAAIGGTLTFFLLNTRSMESYRRTVFISLSVLVLLTLGVVITSLGLPSFLAWVDLHQKEYYVVGQTLGTLSYPCTREIPQLLLRRAEYIPIISVWQTRLLVAHGALPGHCFDFRTRYLRVDVPFRGRNRGDGYRKKRKMAAGFPEEKRDGKRRFSLWRA